MDILAFTRRVAMNYINAAKTSKLLPPNITFLRKRSWKGNAAVPENEKSRETLFLLNVLRHDVKFAQTSQEFGTLLVKLAFILNHV